MGALTPAPCMLGSTSREQDRGPSSPPGWEGAASLTHPYSRRVRPWYPIGLCALTWHWGHTRWHRRAVSTAWQATEPPATESELAAPQACKGPDSFVDPGPRNGSWGTLKPTFKTAQVGPAPEPTSPGGLSSYCHWTWELS